MAETKDKLATLSQVKRYVESVAGGGGAQSDNTPLKLLASNNGMDPTKVSFDLPSKIDEAEVTLVILAFNNLGLFSVSVNAAFLLASPMPIYAGLDDSIKPSIDLDNRSITLAATGMTTILAVYWIRSQSLRP